MQASLLARIYASTVLGIDGHPILVEVDLRNGFPSFTIVGLPDVGIRESRERVVSAIRNSGYEMPHQKITVNMAPAHIKKEGSHFDLAMALGILEGSGQVSPEVSKECGFIGELGLNGEIRPVWGVLPCVIGFRERGFKRVIVPRGNLSEARLVKGIETIGCGTLGDVVNCLNGDPPDDPPAMNPVKKIRSEEVIDWSDIKGQYSAKRALEIAASGGHNILLLGAPGSGKTLLSKCLSSILPPMDFEEALEATKIHSVAGLLRNRLGLMTDRPFRSPHHGISDVAMIGGGKIPRPGEISLSHRGVLFLDEFLEFNRKVLEALRQPLESGTILISRASGTVQFPSDFILIAAANPCPCGFFGVLNRTCVCGPVAIQKYRSKLSGPLLDRIDLHLEIQPLPVDEITQERTSLGESSESVRKRVIQARAIQKNRYSKFGIVENAQLSGRLLRRVCQLDQNGRNILKRAITQLGLSARGHDRVLRLARTIADLANSEFIGDSHVAEAVSYRALDKMVGATQVGGPR